MANLVFDPQKSAETLRAVLTAVLAAWWLLPPEVHAQIEARRRDLSAILPTQKDYQRVGSIIEFLNALEALPGVETVAAKAFAQGKGPAMRSIAHIAGAEVDELQTLLLQPPPARAESQPRQPVDVEFFVKLSFPATLNAAAEVPLIVQLSRSEPPKPQQGGRVLVAFDDLNSSVMVEVALTVDGFTEQTGSLTRTIAVYSNADSLPAVFLLKAGQADPNAGFVLNFYLAVGSVARKVPILTETPRGSFRGAESLGGEAVVDYYTRVHFPGEVLPRAVNPLVVRLSLQADTASAALAKAGIHFADTRKPEFIEVVVTAPGFSEETGCWRRIINLYSHSNSQPAVFLLQTGVALGNQMVSLDFYHRGRAVLCTAFVTAVVEQLAPTAMPLMLKAGPQQIEDLPAQAPSPPDLELRIVLDPQSNTLQFTLHSEIAELGYQRRYLGAIKLAAYPRQFLDQLFVRLSELAATAVEQPTEGDSAEQFEELEAIGQGLFEQLFPKALQREYWKLKTLREAGKVRTLLIISDEPWIPWELVKPYYFDQETNEEHNDGFLAEAFQLTRWLAGRGPAAGVEVKAARLVAPDLDLEYTEQERSYFAQLEQKGVQVGPPLRTKSEVLQTMRRGEIKLLHLAAHGNFRPDNVDESPLVLQGDELLRPSELAGARITGLRRERPLVFLNACHSGQLDFALTGLGGWAEKMVGEIGVSAFVGSLWEVNDLLAAEFAVQFYENLIAGQTLSAAFLAARQHIKARQPANPTWLAYTLYADPNGKVTWSIMRKT